MNRSEIPNFTVNVHNEAATHESMPAMENAAPFNEYDMDAPDYEFLY